MLGRARRYRSFASNFGSRTFEQHPTLKDRGHQHPPIRLMVIFGVRVGEEERHFNDGWEALHAESYCGTFSLLALKRFRRSILEVKDAASQAHAAQRHHGLDAGEALRCDERDALVAAILGAQRASDESWPTALVAAVIIETGALVCGWETWVASTSMNDAFAQLLPGFNYNYVVSLLRDAPVYSD